MATVEETEKKLGKVALSRALSKAKHLLQIEYHCAKECVALVAVRVGLAHARRLQRTDPRCPICDRTMAVHTITVDGGTIFVGETVVMTAEDQQQFATALERLLAMAKSPRGRATRP